MSEPTAQELVLRIVTECANAFVQGTANQAEAVRIQSGASVRLAQEKADIAEIEQKNGLLIVASLIVSVSFLLAESFFFGRYEIATHILAVMGGAVAGGVPMWFIGRQSRSDKTP
jgi:hypothetical protein